eukprot:GHVS01105885.1.p1 GENE.GHVS01105885.1~~GHVS01105885.1.p1  ORF type:complete len:315 (+),score=77.29 GHVS01105885.1:343-1287(+)
MSVLLVLLLSMSCLGEVFAVVTEAVEDVLAMTSNSTMKSLDFTKANEDTVNGQALLLLPLLLRPPGSGGKKDDAVGGRGVDELVVAVVDEGTDGVQDADIGVNATTATTIHEQINVDIVVNATTATTIHEQINVESDSDVNVSTTTTTDLRAIEGLREEEEELENLKTLNSNNTKTYEQLESQTNYKQNDNVSNLKQQQQTERSYDTSFVGEQTNEEDFIKVEEQFNGNCLPLKSRCAHSEDCCPTIGFRSGGGNCSKGRCCKGGGSLCRTSWECCIGSICGNSAGMARMVMKTCVRAGVFTAGGPLGFGHFMD